jgi:uncharacterized membrane protein YkoI
MKLIKFQQMTVAGLMAFGLTSLAQQALTIEQLPAPVQNVLKTETKNGPVNNVQQLNKSGKVVYQVGFQQANGEKNIYLNPDGSYYQEIAASTNAPIAYSGRSFDVKIEQLPANVQSVIKSETSNGPIQRIQQMAHNGRAIYKVMYQKPDGSQKVVYLNKDGTYVSDQAQTAVGAPPANTTGSRTSLSNASKVTFAQLPAPVQRAIKASAGAASVEDVDKGMLNGKTVYEAAFKQNGQTVELRVDEQGNVIQDTQDQAILSNQK